MTIEIFHDGHLYVWIDTFDDRSCDTTLVLNQALAKRGCDVGEIEGHRPHPPRLR